MNSWRATLNDRVLAAGQSQAIKDEQFEYTWFDVQRMVDDLATVLDQFQRPTIIAGHRNAQMILAISCLLTMDEAGLTIDKTQIASTLESLHQQLPTHNLILHEADLQGFHALLEGLGYELNKAVVLNSFEPDRWLGRPVIISTGAQQRGAKFPALTDECGWLLMTSGTTAAPKIVLVGKSDLIQRAKGEIRDFGISGRDTILNLLPVSHDVGFNQILSWWMSGCRRVVQGNSSSSRLRKNFSDEKITGVSGTPLMWSSFFRTSNESDAFDSVRFVTISGGTLPRSQRLRLKEIFPKADVFRTYGQTETFRSLIQKNRLTEETQGSPLSGVHLKLVDPKGNEVLDGVEGELVHSGDGTMLGYLDRKSTSREVPTGDYFIRNSAGEFLFVGRKDDLIKRWEIRMHLSEVEDTLQKCPGVLGVCALHRPCADHRQNELIAFIVLDASQEEFRNLSFEQAQEELKQYCMENLASAKIPDEINVIAEFPITASQKIDRAALRTTWEKKHAQQRS